MRKWGYNITLNSKSSSKTKKKGGCRRFEDSESLSNMRGVKKKCKQYVKRLQEVGRIKNLNNMRGGCKTQKTYTVVHYTCNIIMLSIVSCKHSKIFPPIQFPLHYSWGVCSNTP
jgi:hypothetical protein